MLTLITLKIKPHTSTKIRAKQSQDTLQLTWDVAKPAAATGLDGPPLWGQWNRLRSFLHWGIFTNRSEKDELGGFLDRIASALVLGLLGCRSLSGRVTLCSL